MSLRMLSKLAIVSWFWRNYKSVILGALSILLTIILIHWLHGDYLDYVQRSGNPGATAYVGVSFLIKWGLILLVAIGYVAYVRGMVRKDRSVKHTGKPGSRAPTSEQPDAADDPFAHLRHKPRLQGRGDKLINK